MRTQVQLTVEDILAAAEIWCQMQEAMVWWGGPRRERNPDGSISFENVAAIPAVNDLAWAIKTQFKPLADAFSKTPNTSSGDSDRRVAEIKAALQGIIDKL